MIVPVALPVSATAVPGHETVRPVTGLTREESITLPAKLKVLVRTTETAALLAPELKSTGVPAERLKSPTCAVTVVELVTPPPAPVIITA